MRLIYKSSRKFEINPRIELHFSAQSFLRLLRLRLGNRKGRLQLLAGLLFVFRLESVELLNPLRLFECNILELLQVERFHISQIRNRPVGNIAPLFDCHIFRQALPCKGNTEFGVALCQEIVMRTGNAPRKSRFQNIGLLPLLSNR